MPEQMYELTITVVVKAIDKDKLLEIAHGWGPPPEIDDHDREEGLRSLSLNVIGKEITTEHDQEVFYKSSVER